MTRTGIETTKKTSYFQKRLTQFGFKKKANYNKLDIIADIDTNYILDFNFFKKQRHDCFVAKKLFKRFQFKNKIILGDGAYDCEELHQILKKKNCKLISKVRKNSFKQKHKKLSLRNKLAKNFPEEIYKKRNNVEAVFSSLKRVQLNNLRMKRRKIEITWQILYYNIRQSFFYFIFSCRFLKLKIQNFQF